MMNSESFFDLVVHGRTGRLEKEEFYLAALEEVHGRTGRLEKVA